MPMRVTSGELGSSASAATKRTKRETPAIRKVSHLDWTSVYPRYSIFFEPDIRLSEKISTGAPSLLAHLLLQ